MTDRLSVTDIEIRLTTLPGWTTDSEARAIRRVFTFDSFSSAFGFMARAALAAEKLDHHPDWSNSYDRVSVSLSTHSAGGVTGKDIALAEAMERIFGV